MNAATPRDLDALLRDPGFTPRARDATPLFERLGGEEAVARLAERALLRLGPALTKDAIAAFGKALEDSERALVAAGIARLLGRVEGDLVAIAGALESGLRAASPRVRRASAIALGKLAADGEGAMTIDATRRAALLEAFKKEQDASVKRALAESLGKIGGADAEAALVASGASARAQVMVARAEARETAIGVDATRSPHSSLLVVLRSRAGLEELLASELHDGFDAGVVRDRFGPRVEARLDAPLTSLFAARTMLDFAFPLPAVTLDHAADDPVADAAARALTSPAARVVFDAFTKREGATETPIRYRLAWAEAGKRRASIFRAAALVRERAPRLVNDPNDSDWTALVRVRGEDARVELTPRIDDPRFAYRKADVPAASHPTIAAALALIGGVRRDDVVWDPFCGSGLELCERGLAGPFARLVGSDHDPEALAIARENLTSAGLQPFDLIEGDALKVAPPRAPSLILTNPPLGRRIERTPQLRERLARFVVRAATLLAPRGRLVWISPFAATTREAAEKSGLKSTTTLEIDLGGFTGTIQAFEKR